MEAQYNILYQIEGEEPKWSMENWIRGSTRSFRDKFRKNVQKNSGKPCKILEIELSHKE